QSPYLGQASDAGLHRMAMPVGEIDIPEQLILGLAQDRMGARPHDAHIAAQHVEHLRQFIEAGRADEAADACDPVVVTAGGPAAQSIALLGVHAAELVYL